MRKSSPYFTATPAFPRGKLSQLSTLPSFQTPNLLLWLFIVSFFFFLFGCITASGILVPQPGIEPMPPAVEAQSPDHWTAREVPYYFLFI